MAISNIKANFESNIQEVWNIVTSLEKYQWRSDLGKIEVIDDKQFVEIQRMDMPLLLRLLCLNLVRDGNLIWKTVI